MSYTLSHTAASASSPLLSCVKSALARCSLAHTVKAITEELSPTGSGIYLTLPSGEVIGQSTAILRTIANASPYANLYGPGDLYSTAVVDQWIDASVSLLAVPVVAYQNAPDAKAIADRVSQDLQSAYSVLDKQLLERTYIACDYITAADLILASVMTEAAAISSIDAFVNVVRWHNTITAKGVAGADAPPAPPSSSTASSTHSGLSLSGVPPAVTEVLFKRSRIRIKEALKLPENTAVTVSGWARTVRSADAGKLLFIELNDGSCAASVQCVITKETPGFDEAVPKVSGGTGASFTVVGSLVASQGAGQALEVNATSVKLLGAVMGGDVNGTIPGGAFYPLAKKGHSVEYLRENAHLRARTKMHAAAMRIRHAMAFATHKFFNDHGFLYIHTPIVTCADCEGAGEQFAVTTLLTTDPHKLDLQLPKVPEPPKDPEEEAEVGPDGEKKELSTKAKKKAEKRAAALAKKAAAEAATKMRPDPIPQPVGSVDYSLDFFQKRANLTVSGQLNVETHACALSDVYTFGPTFRAENSHTSRHLAEFWMIEPEVAFADLEMDIDLAEDFIKYCAKYALELCAEDLEFFETSDFGEKGLRDRLKNVVESPFKVSSLLGLYCFVS
jgi:aspartyl/asparaginyl-tRNA synthetase/glutathione S-transferase